MTVIPPRFAACVVIGAVLFVFSPAFAAQVIAIPSATQAQNAMNAMVDAATRAHSIDPTDPTKEGTRALLRGRAIMLSASVARSLQQAQIYMGDEKPMQALNAANAARDLAISQYDKLKINQFLTFIYLHLKDDAAAAAAEAAADLSAIPDTEKKNIYTSATLLALNARHYDKAEKYAQAMQAMNLTDAQSQKIIGQALYFGGDMAGAEAVLQKQVDAAIAAGQKPDQGALEIVLSVQAQSQNTDEAKKTLDLLNTYYGDPRNWEKIIELLHDIDIWNATHRTDDLRAKGLLPGGA